MDFTYGIRGIKDRLGRMPPPLPDKFESTESEEGDLYGAHYTATVGLLEKQEGKLKGLLWVIAIHGSNKCCDRALEDFIYEIGERPVDSLEMPSLIPPDILRVYFWNAQQQLH